MLLVVMTMALFVVYELNVSEDPAYMQTPTAVKSSKSRPLLGLMITVAILLIIYLVAFGVTLVKNLFYIKQLTYHARIAFLFNLPILVITVVSLVFGIYQPYYGNGQAFIFFLAFMNLYVWALLYLHWPMGWETDFSAPNQNSQSSGQKETQEIEMGNLSRRQQNRGQMFQVSQETDISHIQERDLIPPF